MFKKFVRWLLIGFLVFIVLPVACVTYTLFRQEPVHKHSILHVVLDGPVADTPQPSLKTLVGGRMRSTLRELTQSIRRAGTDDRIVGLLLEVRTEQLGIAQVSEISDAIAAFKQSGKWNASFLESAGELGHGDKTYAMACAADQVFLSPPGDVGLSGLRTETPFLKETLARFHVQAFADKRYEYKNFPNTFTQDGYTPEHLEALKHVLDDLQDSLLRMMATGRKVTVEEAKRWVLASPYAASDALEAHLVDHVGYFDEVLAAAEKVAGRSKPLVEVDEYSDPMLDHGLRRGSHDVALIVMNGQIVQGESGKNPAEPSDMVGSDTITQALRDAREDKVRGVVLRVDSPGGSYVASDLIRREVQLTREAGIPVVVSMGNLAASGGYFVSTDADHIVAQPGTITGSIGVFAASFALREAMNHFLGANFGVYETLPHPGTLQWLDPPNEADRERLSKSLDRIYKDFVTKVSEGRHKTYDEVHKLAKGRIWSGRQALQNGLADELGGIDTALNYLRQRLHLQADDDMRVVYYPEPENALSIVRNLLDARLGVTGVTQQLPPMVRALWTAMRQTLVPWEQNALLLPFYGAGDF